MRRQLALDAGVAGLAFGVLIAMLASGGFGESGGARPVDVLGVLLAAASTFPLAARQRAPLATYLATAAASLALLGFGYPLDVPIGPMVAVYALGRTYGGAELPARRLAALLAAGLFVPATVAIYALRQGDLAGIAPEMLFWAVVLCGLWLAGDRSRLRHKQIVALEQRAERERRLAVAEERTRIARELHDSAGHAINVILVEAGAARLLHERDPQRSRRAITTIEQVARATIDEIDRLVRALREEDGREAVPADPAALEELLDRHRAAGLAVGADLIGPRAPLPRSVAWASYRILQEALTNAGRHGRGGAHVTVSFEPSAVDITVTNPCAPGPDRLKVALANQDGAMATFSQAPERGGHGIIGMRERATLLGGTFEAVAAAGTFRVHAHLPHGDSA